MREAKRLFSKPAAAGAAAGAAAAHRDGETKTAFSPQKGRPNIHVSPIIPATELLFFFPKYFCSRKRYTFQSIPIEVAETINSTFTRALNQNFSLLGAKKSVTVFSAIPFATCMLHGTSNLKNFWEASTDLRSFSPVALSLGSASAFI